MTRVLIERGRDVLSVSLYSVPPPPTRNQPRLEPDAMFTRS